MNLLFSEEDDFHITPEMLASVYISEPPPSKKLIYEKKRKPKLIKSTSKEPVHIKGLGKRFP